MRLRLGNFFGGKQELKAGKREVSLGKGRVLVHLFALDNTRHSKRFRWKHRDQLDENAGALEKALGRRGPGGSGFGLDSTKALALWKSAGLTQARRQRIRSRLHKNAGALEKALG